jgi:hypothetical protein
MTHIETIIKAESEQLRQYRDINQKVEDLIGRSVVCSVHTHHDDVRVSIWSFGKDDPSEAASLVLIEDPFWEKPGTFTPRELDIIEEVLAS